MKPKVLLLLLLLQGITSCMTAYKMKTVRVDLLEPSQIDHPERIHTIALLGRDTARMDTVLFKYYLHNKPATDSSIHYSDLYNTCISALEQTLKEEGYFPRVINYKDSLNESIRGLDSMTVYDVLFNKTGADALVLLDRFKLNDFQYQAGDFGSSEIREGFPEFAKSARLANIWGSLLWTIAIKGDTSRYTERQMEDLYYGNTVYPELFGSEENHRQMIQNTCVYFGSRFAERLIPSWQQAERYIYTSADTALTKATQYCQDGQWIKAAEIYKRLTSSTKRNRAACAAFNMAFVCEMEGELDAATDWLKRSMQADKPLRDVHQENCTNYLEILQQRKKEIEILELQSRKNPAKEILPNR